MAEQGLEARKSFKLTPTIRFDHDMGPQASSCLSHNSRATRSQNVPPFEDNRSVRYPRVIPSTTRLFAYHARQHIKSVTCYLDLTSADHVAPTYDATMTLGWHPRLGMLKQGKHKSLAAQSVVRHENDTHSQVSIMSFANTWPLWTNEKTRMFVRPSA